MIVRLTSKRVDSESVAAAIKLLRQANALMFPDGYYHGHISEEDNRDLLRDPSIATVYDLFDKLPRHDNYALRQTKIYGVKFFKDLRGDRFPWIEGLDE